jgi:hypothetical protein
MFKNPSTAGRGDQSARTSFFALLLCSPQSWVAHAFIDELLFVVGAVVHDFVCDAWDARGQAIFEASTVGASPRRQDAVH